jgi:HSP20 family protein
METTVETTARKDVATTPPPGTAAGSEREVFLLPSIDVVEDAHGLTLYADMPGVNKDGLSVEVEGDTLLIEGRNRFSLPSAAKPVYAEQRSISFRRRFTMSGDLERDKIDARLTNGVLTLRIPKTEAAKPRRITVRSG